jgi:cysteine desulfurase/selenocysteine lyase
VVVDAAQSVGHLPVHFADLGADLLAFSAHKLYGPAGVGVLVGSAQALASLEPLEGGGQMIDEVALDRASWAPVPQRFEAGTMDVAAVAAFVPALDLIDELGLPEIRAREQRLVGSCWDRLARLGGLRLLGPAEPEQRGSLVSFADDLVHPHDLATLLDAHGVAVRAGHHCAQPLHRKLGLAASVRASFGVYSSADEIDRLVEGVKHARQLFS